MRRLLLVLLLIVVAASVLIEPGDAEAVGSQAPETPTTAAPANGATSSTAAAPPLAPAGTPATGAPAGPAPSAPKAPTVDCRQVAGSKVRLATKPVEPFVFAGSEPRGFSIDLWHDLAGRLGVQTEYVPTATVPELLATVREGRADAGIGAVSITRQREQDLDFSVPIYTSGLQVMTRSSGSTTGFWSRLALLADARVLRLLLFLLVLLLAAAVIIWLVERRRNPDFPKGLAGMGEGLWWATVTMGTVGYGDRVARTKTGRLFSALWILLGLLLVAQLTATVTARLTLDELTTDTTTLEQLPGKRTVTVRDTAAAAVLAQRRIDADLVPDIDTMVNRVANGEADAAVYDAPVLRYAAQRDQRLYVAPGVLTLDYYGIAFPQESPLRECVDQALLDAVQDGTWHRLNEAWFGRS